MHKCTAQRRYTIDKLYSTFLGRTAAIVWQRRHILDHHHFDTIVGKGTDSAFTTAAGTFYKDIHFLQTCVKGSFSGIGRCHLRSIRSILLGTLKAHFTGAAPGDHLAILVGKADNDVVETGYDMCVAIHVNFYDPFLCSGFRAVCLCFCHTLNEVVFVAALLSL